MPTRTTREGLAALYGKGRLTFYARFRRYGIKKPLPGEPISNFVSEEWRTLLVQVMDENLQVVADHVWTDLPKTKDDCQWAIPLNQPLRLEATVGRYEVWKRGVDGKKRRTDEVSYNFLPVWKYEKLKHFPVETPAMVEGYYRFFNHVVADPKLLKIWVESDSLIPRLPYPEVKFEIS